MLIKVLSNTLHLPYPKIKLHKRSIILPIPFLWKYDTLLTISVKRIDGGDCCDEVTGEERWDSGQALEGRADLWKQQAVVLHQAVGEVAGSLTVTAMLLQTDKTIKIKFRNKITLRTKKDYLFYTGMLKKALKKIIFRLWLS